MWFGLFILCGMIWPTVIYKSRLDPSKNLVTDQTHSQKVGAHVEKSRTLQMTKFRRDHWIYLFAWNT